MQAAFISCGLERNCYLSIEETYTDYSKYDGTMGGSGPQLPELKEGDEIIVQVTKPPRGNKGAKVTTHLSFVGKNLIFLPNTDFVGISRKITDPELRENLLFTADRMREREGEGFIVRTQAPFVTRKQLKTEAEYLKNLYRDMRDFAKGAAVGAVLYKDFDLPVRVMRDSMGDDVTAMYVGDDDLYERLFEAGAPARGHFRTKADPLYGQARTDARIRNFAAGVCGGSADRTAGQRRISGDRPHGSDDGGGREHGQLRRGHPSRGHRIFGESRRGAGDREAGTPAEYRRDRRGGFYRHDGGGAQGSGDRGIDRVPVQG